MTRWVTWNDSAASHRVTVVGVDSQGRECCRTRCGRRVYVAATRVEASDDARCVICSGTGQKFFSVPPPVSTWSDVRRFDLVDTEEL